MFTSSKVNSNIALDWPAIMAAHEKKATDPRLRNFYAASIVDRKKDLRNVPFVALDFETTGLNPNIDDIVSIGLVPFDFNRIYCRQALHWLINPRKPLEENSIIIHGITHSEITKAPDLDHILDEMLAALTGKMIVVHYNRIERDFLNSALMVRLGEGIQFPVIDTMAIELAIQRKRLKNFWKRLNGRPPLSIRLGSSRERYGLPPYKAHHALIDAIATAELFQAQVTHHFSHRTTLEELWL